MEDKYFWRRVLGIITMNIGISYIVIAAAFVPHLGYSVMIATYGVAIVILSSTEFMV